MAKDLLKAAPPKKRRVITPRGLDAKYLGEEPTWEGQEFLNEDELQSRIGQAYNWYNYFYEAKEGRKWLIEYMTEQQFSKTAQSMVIRVSDSKLNSTMCNTARMISMGLDAPQYLRDKLDNYLANCVKQSVEAVEAEAKTATVTVTVIGPQGNLASANQVEVSEDNTFETMFSTAGALFKENGMYTIRAQYGPQEINDKVMVELVGEAASEESACGDGELAVKGGSETFCVPFESSGLVVTKTTANSATKSLILKITSESDGSLSLAIPRNVLEAQENGSDVDFIVLVDGEEADFEETDTTDSARSLDITVPAGSSEIEIIGTYAVPEFGTMAAIILAVAIVSIIAVSARTRLSISPRY